MDKSKFAIVGHGARTPLGYDCSSSAAAVRCGISAIAEHPFMIDRFGQPMKVTRDVSLATQLEASGRLSELLISAALEAIAPLSKASSLPEVSLVVSIGESRPGQEVPTDVKVTRALCNVLANEMPVGRVLHWMRGHAGGIEAMNVARHMIFEEQAEIVLVGGVDSYIVPETLEWLDEIEQLHSDNNIYGFCPGEAAGVVLITRDETARKLGLVQLLDLVSVGSGIEKNLIKTEDICLGHGLAAAFGLVASPLGESETVDRILCDMNGERYRGNEYGFAVLKTSKLFKNAAEVQTPADCWGDVGAASGPLFACLAVEAEKRGYSHGPLTLIWASSEGGHRSAAIFRRSGGD